MNITELELSFQRYVQNLSEWLPDGVLNVDLALLQRLNLLDFASELPNSASITQYFHVVEAEEKITLFNDHYVIWIVPSLVDNMPTTFVLVALREEQNLHLELAFATSGIYNTSQLVLKVLEKLLLEVQETQEELNHYQKQEGG